MNRLPSVLRQRNIFVELIADAFRSLVVRLYVSRMLLVILQVIDDMLTGLS